MFIYHLFCVVSVNKTHGDHQRWRCPVKGMEKREHVSCVCIHSWLSESSSAKIAYAAKEIEAFLSVIYPEIITVK